MTRRHVAVAAATALVAALGLAGCNLRVTSGNGPSTSPSISIDGRYVTFQSEATNLVPGDTNGEPDVFLFDRETWTYQRVGGNDWSYQPSVSEGGSRVAFMSLAADLVPGPDGEGTWDIFVWEPSTGAVTRVTKGPPFEMPSTQPVGHSQFPKISASGRYVVFESEASDLVPGDTNGLPDVFLWDGDTGTTTRVSTGNRGGTQAAISPDGTYVAYTSGSTDLSPPDTNGIGWDVFLWEVATGTTTRITNGNGHSRNPSVSAGGAKVAFASDATDLAGPDEHEYIDLYVWDAATGSTTRFTDGNGHSWYPAISADGSTIAFQSAARNLTSEPDNGWPDMFLADVATGAITDVTHGNRISATASISGDGRYTAFQSAAFDIGNVPDTNSAYDIFVWDQLHYPSDPGDPIS